jgi:hypothetical protein
MTNPSAIQDRYPYQNEPIWSKSEKIIARKDFDAALLQRLARNGVVKENANHIAQLGFRRSRQGLPSNRLCRRINIAMCAPQALPSEKNNVANSCAVRFRRIVKKVRVLPRKP